MHKERVDRLLARAEQHRMLMEGRDSVSSGKRSWHSWLSLLRMALNGLQYGRDKTSYRPSSSVQR